MTRQQFRSNAERSRSKQLEGLCTAKKRHGSVGNCDLDIRNEGVAGSSPSCGTSIMKGLLLFHWSAAPSVKFVATFWRSADGKRGFNLCTHRQRGRTARARRNSNGPVGYPPMSKNVRRGAGRAEEHQDRDCRRHQAAPRGRGQRFSKARPAFRDRPRRWQPAAAAGRAPARAAVRRSKSRTEENATARKIQQPSSCLEI